MTPTQQRALTGTMAGAGVGAVFWATGGNAGLGAGAGLPVDQSRRSQDVAFEEGVHRWGTAGAADHVLVSDARQAGDGITECSMQRVKLAAS
jgi:hypothetical protein